MFFLIRKNKQDTGCQTDLSKRHSEFSFQFYLFLSWNWILASPKSALNSLFIRSVTKLCVGGLCLLMSLPNICLTKCCYVVTEALWDWPQLSMYSIQRKGFKIFSCNIFLKIHDLKNILRNKRNLLLFLSIFLIK